MDKQTRLKILRDARELLAKPNGWIQGSFARNKYGVATLIESSTACSFCAWGAVRRASLLNGHDVPVEYDVTGIPDTNFINFNDQPGRTKEEVLDYFDEIIKKVENE